jgi:hypothetical protein
MMRTTRLFSILLVLLGAAACDKGGAFGDETSIVTGMTPELWSQVEDDVYAALEPTIFTVRDEATFTVTYHDPQEELWGRLRQFKQLLLAGTGEEAFLADVMDELDDEDRTERPRVVQLRNVWARGQLVTVVLLPEGDPAESLRELLPDLGELYDTQYRELSLARMFISGRDSALVTTLREEAGFSLLLPEVYYWDRADSVYIFRNDNPDPAELIRQVGVTWRTPIPEELTGDEILAWRQSVAEAYYSFPQVVDLANAEAETFYHEGLSTYQLQAVWSNPPGEWPAAGPFILWAVSCPDQDRLYMVDAWLYAPGKEKYQYMIQLQTILESFRCGS